MRSSIFHHNLCQVFLVFSVNSSSTLKSRQHALLSGECDQVLQIVIVFFEALIKRMLAEKLFLLPNTNGPKRSSTDAAAA